MLTSCGVITLRDPYPKNASSETTTSSSDKVPASGTAGTTALPSDTAEPAYFDADSREKDAEAYALSLFNGVRAPNLAGATFLITATDTSTLLPSGTTYADKLRSNRASDISKRFNCDVVVVSESVNMMLTELKTAVLSDSYYSDLIALPLSSVGAFAAAGTLMNMNSLPFFDETAPYCNASFTAACGGGDALYAVSGDALLDDLDTPLCYVNKSLLGADPPYELVRGGKWTYDAFLTLTAQGQAETAIALDRSVYPDDGAFADCLYVALGGRWVRGGVKTTPSVAFTPSGVKNVIDALSAMLGLGRYAYSDGDDAFAGSVSLWYFSSARALSDLADTPVNFGIFPLPAAKEGGGYAYGAPSDALVFAVPVNNKNPEAISAVTQGYLAWSHGRGRAELIGRAMNYYVRDEGSLDSLEAALGAVRADFAQAFGSAYPSVGALQKLTRSLDLSSYEKYASNAQTDLSAYFTPTK